MKFRGGDESKGGRISNVLYENIYMEESMSEKIRYLSGKYGSKLLKVHSRTFC